MRQAFVEGLDLVDDARVTIKLCADAEAAHQAADPDETPPRCNAFVEGLALDHDQMIIIYGPGGGSGKGGPPSMSPALVEGVEVGQNHPITVKVFGSGQTIRAATGAPMHRALVEGLQHRGDLTFSIMPGRSSFGGFQGR